MKIKCVFCLLCLLIILTGCDKAEKSALQLQISELQSTNVALQEKLTELSNTNLMLEGKLLETQEKVKSGEDLNTLLRQQLDSANAQINKNLETAKANAEQEKLKPIADTIHAFRKFDSAVTASITFDEYRDKLQELKVALDENDEQIQDNEIRQNFQDAYADYQDAFSVWAASLGQEVGNYGAALKRHGLWLKTIPDDQKNYYQQAATIGVPEDPVSLYNFSMLKYDVTPCLQACCSSAKNHIETVEQRIKGQTTP